MDKKIVKPWQWGLYDFANSLANVVVSFYFALWFIENVGGADYWVSIVVVLATVLLLWALPVFGAYVDRTGKHVKILTICTLCSIVTLGLLGAVTMNVITLTPISLVLTLTLYGTFQFFYQTSAGIYNSLVRFVAQSSDQDLVHVSGIGMAMGQIGNVVGLIAALPIATAFGRPATFLVGAFLFLIFAMPSLFYLRKLTVVTSETLARTSILATWKKLQKQPNVLRYLVGYYFFADAVLTLQLFLSVYLTIVGGLSDGMKTALLASTLLVAAIGALCAKKISKRSSIQRAIEISIMAWVILLVAFALINIPSLFILVTLLNGFAFGVLFSLSQAFYSSIIPADEQAEHFSFYTIFERASSLLGPLLWSAVLLIFADYGNWRYRIAMLSLAGLVGSSLFFIRKVKKN